MTKSKIHGRAKSQDTYEPPDAASLVARRDSQLRAYYEACRLKTPDLRRLATDDLRAALTMRDAIMALVSDGTASATDFALLRTSMAAVAKCFALGGIKPVDAGVCRECEGDQEVDGIECERCEGRGF